MAGHELRLGGAERLVESVIDRHTCVHRAALAFGYGCVNLNWSPNCGHHDWHEALSTVGRFGRLRRTGTGRRWETRYSPQVL
jgi:hypothetical protein